MPAQGLPPEWLQQPAAAVLEDLQGAQAVPGLQIVATIMDNGINGLYLGLVEPTQTRTPLQQLPDNLDPGEPTGYGGGNWVPRSMSGPELLVHVAELLQEDLAETAVAWGQARPPCPRHPHPTRPVLRDCEAWWICQRDNEPLYRIGRGEVPTRLTSPTAWHPAESRRARKRRHH
jgi:hypothetical protein